MRRSVSDPTAERGAMAPTRSSRYDCRLLGSTLKTATRFLGHHIIATFELRADEAEHSSTLIM
jgi:hypothetical protein